MRRFAFLTAVLLSLSLCGCLSTTHVEYSHAACVNCDTSGCVSCSSEGRQDERHWRGFWLLQPDRVRP
jgi:hypothetical protein